MNAQLDAHPVVCPTAGVRFPPRQARARLCGCSAPLGRLEQELQEAMESASDLLLNLRSAEAFFQDALLSRGRLELDLGLEFG